MKWLSKMVGALLEFDEESGRVKQILLIADSDKEEELAAYALARITNPRVWYWLKRLVRIGAKPSWLKSPFQSFRSRDREGRRG